jgi:hypothetical protein
VHVRVHADVLRGDPLSRAERLQDVVVVPDRELGARQVDEEV